MHDTAATLGRRFFETYCPSSDCAVLEIGSQNVNGALRDYAPNKCAYTGVDICAADGVDIVLTDPYVLPFQDNYFDATVSSSCFEHDQMFWLTFLEMLRVTKDGGHLYINAPSNGTYHPYPVDNWRFYPGAGKALVDWARRQGGEVELLESFIARREADVYNDCVMVFRKGPPCPDAQPGRLLAHFPSAYNALVQGRGDLVNPSDPTEDMLLLDEARRRIDEQELELVALRSELAAIRRVASAQSIPLPLLTDLVRLQERVTEVAAGLNRMHRLAAPLAG